MNTGIKSALDYAKKGLHVFPVHSVNDGLCTCGKADCEHPGKHPRTSHGLLDATTDPATITEWWTLWPDANIGVRTGIISGIVVVDVDPRHEGDRTWSELQDFHGRVDTSESYTGGGGSHYFFQAPEDGLKSVNNAPLGPGVDLKGEGGYVIAPPSRHESGDYYEWVTEGIAPTPIPDWLLSIWPKSNIGANGHHAVESIGETIPDGRRNSRLASLAGTMRRRGPITRTS